MRRSTQDAHYTSEIVVRAIWSALERLGFRGGKILEPAFGIGHFWGLMPATLRRASHCIAVELDPLTAAIAHQLYPSVRLQAGVAFQQFSTAPESFDLAIGNPPFGSQLIFHADDRTLCGLSIHNYFFARCIQALRPGAFLVMVVSTYLLDAQNPRARQILRGYANLLGAIRLPHTAFKANAGTEVTTDIILLQRRASDEPVNPLDWTTTVNILDPAGGDPIPLNRYFHTHPEMILGRIERAPSRFGPQPTVIPTGDLRTQLENALAHLPRDVYRHAPESPEHAPAPTIAFDEILAARTKVYGYFLDSKDGAIWRRLPDLNGELRVELIFRRQLGRAADSPRQRMGSMIELRDQVLRQLQMEIQGTDSPETIEEHRRRLRNRYEIFRSYCGFLHEPANKSLMRDDPQWPLLLAIETDYDKGLSREVAAALNVRSRPRTAKLGMILRQRVRWPYSAPTHAANARDALLICLAQRARLDLDFMSLLTGKDPDQLLTDLREEVFCDPLQGWQTRDEYLSGPVKQKLAAAEQLVAQGRSEFVY